MMDELEALAEGHAQLRAELEIMRDTIDSGDAYVLAQINDTILPIIERIADKLERAIADIGAQVEERLSAMEREVRDALPSAHSECDPLVQRENVN